MQPLQRPVPHMSIFGSASLSDSSDMSTRGMAICISLPVQKWESVTETDEILLHRNPQMIPQCVHRDP